MIRIPNHLLALKFKFTRHLPSVERYLSEVGGTYKTNSSYHTVLLIPLNLIYVLFRTSATLIPANPNTRHTFLKSKFKKHAHASFATPTNLLYFHFYPSPQLLNPTPVMDMIVISAKFSRKLLSQIFQNHPL